MIECPLCLREMWFAASRTLRFCGRWQCEAGHYIDVLAMPLDVPPDIAEPVTITEVIGTELRIGTNGLVVA